MCHTTHSLYLFDMPRLCVAVWSVHICVRSQIHLHINTDTHIYIWICVYVHIYTCIRVYTFMDV